MARIIVAGDAMVVESAYSIEDIKTIERYRPKALTLVEEDGKTETFKVGTTDGKGSISTYGVSFGSSSKNGENKAIITLNIPSSVNDAAAYAEDCIGVAIVKLNAVESQLNEALDEISHEKELVRENITIM